MSIALKLVRLLKLIPIRRLQAHLDRCAALEILYAPLLENIPRLSIWQVLGLKPLPDFLRHRHEADQNWVRTIVRQVEPRSSRTSFAAFEHGQQFEGGSPTIH